MTGMAANDPARSQGLEMNAAPARESLFDPTGLLEFADADLVRELTEMFGDQMTAGLPALRAAITSHDPTAIHQIAHGLKGSAATIGAPRIMNICDAICRLAKRGQTDQTVALHTELADAWKDTAAAITVSLRGLDR
jgi:HPt (histidine-containing phosphotransfer) domain-containing protein